MYKFIESKIKRKENCSEHFIEQLVCMGHVDDYGEIETFFNITSPYLFNTPFNSMTILLDKLSATY